MSDSKRVPRERAINEGGQDAVATAAGYAGAQTPTPAPPSPDAKLGTHYGGCYEYHHACALHEIARLQARAEAAEQRCDDCTDYDDV